MPQDVLHSVDDPGALVTLNRPARLNAWTSAMDEKLKSAVRQAESDRSAVGIVITGAERPFCSGADLETLQTRRTNGSDNLSRPSAEAVGGDFSGRFTWLLGTTKPVIVAINGPVAGMAVALALRCDICFIAEDAPGCASLR